MEKQPRKNRKKGKRKIRRGQASLRTLGKKVSALEEKRTCRDSPEGHVISYKNLGGILRRRGGA